MGTEVALSPGEIAPSLSVSPGGVVVLRGEWHVPSQNLVIDACQSGRAGGTPTGMGAFDYAAGGWHLVSRDWATHTCRLSATGEAASVCSAAGVSAPCLPSRLRLLANGLDNPMTYDDLRAEITGGMRAEVLTPAETAATEPPGWAQTHAMGIAGGVGVMAMLFVGARVASRRARTREAMVRRYAARVRRRLAGSDPVYARLVPSIDELARQADELASLRDRLRARADRAEAEGLRARRSELAQRAGASKEASEALALLDERLARVDRWKTESERASDRLDRALEYLRALDARLDDEPTERTGVRVDEDARLLRELERDVQSSLEGAREADRLAGVR